MSWFSDRTGININVNKAADSALGGEAFQGLANQNLGNDLNNFLSSIFSGSDKKQKTPDTSAIDQLLSDAEKKKKEDEQAAADIATRLQRQMMAAFSLEKSGSFAYKRGGTILTSPLGLPDPITTGKVKKAAIGA